jgi:hypothetical protein
MATVDYIHHLAFPKLSDAEAKHLAGMATICDFKDGELVFQVGRRGLPLSADEDHKCRPETSVRPLEPLQSFYQGSLLSGEA